MLGWLIRPFRRGGPVIRVVRLQGGIAEQRPGRLNIEWVAPLLERAFRIKAPAVAIIVNSPGGIGGAEPPDRQAHPRPCDRSMKRQVLVFVEDAAASGGYFIATAGDRDHRRPVGDRRFVGVIFAGFGFGALDKLGVERRVHTAGRNKSTLDPFLRRRRTSPITVDGSRRPQGVHRLGPKRAGSSSRRRMMNCSLANSGARCAGSISASSTRLAICIETLRSRFGDKVRLRLIAPKRGLLQLPPHRPAGRPAAAIEDRAMWTRLGPDMTALLLRLFVTLLIIGAVTFGVRRIWRDWTKQFRAEERRCTTATCASVTSPASSPPSATRMANLPPTGRGRLMRNFGACASSENRICVIFFLRSEIFRGKTTSAEGIMVAEFHRAGGNQSRLVDITSARTGGDLTRRC